MSFGSGAACGHDACSEQCNVRYVGPTTSIRDHHIMHAARGATHVWSAAIVSGLAVVLTGAIAYSAVEAKPVVNDAGNAATELRLLNRRIDHLEKSIAELSAKCVPPKTVSSPVSTTSTKEE